MGSGRWQPIPRVRSSRRTCLDTSELRWYGRDTNSVMPKGELVRRVATAFLMLILAPSPGAALPDYSLSYFVPQRGPVATPTEGVGATRFFRACPNNDGGSSLPLDARIKIVLRDSAGAPVPGVAADQICILFNGGTAAQGFTGLGADSVIANSTWNRLPKCPDVRCIEADAPTDAAGVTYITFGGADASHPGVWVRNPDREWGHYDSELPVFVLGSKLAGRLTTSSPHGSYTLRIRNMDHVGGLGTVLDGGEVVSSLDYNSLKAGLFLSVDPTTYWRDLDESGAVDLPDLNMTVNHMNHDCDTPIAP